MIKEIVEAFMNGSAGYVYSNYSILTDGTVTLSGTKRLAKGVSGYSLSKSPNSSSNKSSAVTNTFYYITCYERKVWTNAPTDLRYYYYVITATPTNTIYKKGNYIEDIIAKDGTYDDDKEDSLGEFWYIRNDIAPKYTLFKYDQDLTLLSTYDVDTATLTTTPIDISNKGRNKLKLTLTASGSDYKTYISNDNINWQEVTDVTSGTQKELDVDGWNNLYIKIETNTSTINNIDIAYYKD